MINPEIKKLVLMLRDDVATAGRNLAQEQAEASSP
jgi:hypothetical protein